MDSQKLSDLLRDGREGRHSQVVTGYLNLSRKEKSDRLAMMAYADALYELGRDVEALNAYVTFVNQYPREKATNFALFAIALCLKNLDLQNEALTILDLIDLKHEGLKEEIDDSNNRINRQLQAKAIIAKIAELKD